MLTILRSQFCQMHFNRELLQPPFCRGETRPACRIVDMPQDPDDTVQLASPGLVLCTNVWPITDDARVLDILNRQCVLNSAATAVVASPAGETATILYPRKNNVRFPATAVTWVTLHPDLLWSAIIREACAASVSLTTLTLLAWDVTFTEIIAAGHCASALIEKLTAEYDQARGMLSENDLEIHGLECAEAVPYAMRKTR